MNLGKEHDALDYTVDKALVRTAHANDKAVTPGAVSIHYTTLINVTHNPPGRLAA